MAEVIGIIGAVGAICNIVDAVTKTVSIINDLRTRWEDADLTLLSLASQLNALRAALSSIQEWIDSDLKEAHHQLVMDLNVSINCCKLLMGKVEGFFSDLGQLTEKPLDLRNKFKTVFGTQGPESVQKLIGRQTNALTLLLTACNCKTLAEQKGKLETTKTRKVLDRAKADSASLYVHRDSASLTSRLTDNLSKISYVFAFDRNVFSSRVYERAFRDSVKQRLKKQQQRINPKPSSPSGQYESILLLGEDEISKDLLINDIHAICRNDYVEKEWLQYRLRMQKLCIELIWTITKRGTPPDWKIDQVSVLNNYSRGPHDETLQFEDVLDACAVLWWSSLRSMQPPNKPPRSNRRENIELEGMTFSVDIILVGGLNIYCTNARARLFMEQMERLLPIGITGPRYHEALPADHLRATAALHSEENYEFSFPVDGVDVHLTTRSENDVTTLPSFQSLQRALVLCFVFDLKDYGTDALQPFSELLPRLESTLASLEKFASSGASYDLPFCLLFSNVGDLEARITETAWPLPDGTLIVDRDAVMSHIASRFEDVVNRHVIICPIKFDQGSDTTRFFRMIRVIRSQRSHLWSLVESVEYSDDGTLPTDTNSTN